VNRIVITLSKSGTLFTSREIVNRTCGDWGPATMTKTTHRLTSAAVKAAGIGLHPDGNGLYLQVVSGRDGQLTKSWFFRYSLGGQERRMGLGPLDAGRGRPEVTLSKARELADAARRQCQDGLDPLVERDAQRAKAQAERRAREAAEAAQRPFREVFEEYFADRAQTLTNDKHIATWRSSLNTYASTLMGRPIAEITPDEILAVVRPIWHSKPETARRVLQRLRLIIDAAIVRGQRKEANPCAGVSDVLGKRRAAVKSFRALPYAEVPAFIARLHASTSWPATRLAFEWLVLTAARSGEVRLARWQEIDEDARLWTIPATRMKARREHIVPLPPRCLEILQALRAVYLSAPSDLLFPSTKAGRPLSDMTFTKYLRDNGLGEVATAHGFRSSFRDWATEVARVREVVAEAALAHIVKDKTEASYRRATYLDERKALMHAWATFSATPAQSAKVMQLPVRTPRR
jgi:integrase